MKKLFSAFLLFSALAIGSSGGSLGGGGGSGTVTSVDLSVPDFLSVSGNPVTSSGTLAVDLEDQAANKVFAGPVSGADSAPEFRLLDVDDIPSLSSLYIPVSGTAALSGDIVPSSAGTRALGDASHQFDYFWGKNLVYPSQTSINLQTGAFYDSNGTMQLQVNGTNKGVGLPNLTADTVPYLNSNKLMTSSSVTPTVLGYISTLSSSAQTQLDAKAPIASPSFTGAVTFGNYHLEPCETDDGNSGTSDTLDLSTCSAHKSTLTGNVTYTLSNPVTGGTYVIKIIQGASAYTVTWPASVKWAGGAAPTITTTNAKIDLVSLYWDGTNYYGTFSQNY